MYKSVAIIYQRTNYYIVMKKPFILTAFIALFFTVTTSMVSAYTPPAYDDDDDTSPEPALSSFTTLQKEATVEAVPHRFTVGNNTGDVKVAVTTSAKFPTSSWGSTRLIFEGKDDVCVNHGNHPLAASQVYSETLTLNTPAVVGQYDLLIQPFSTDDCKTAIGKEVLRVVDAREKLSCLNCDDGEDDNTEDVTTDTGTNDDTVSDTQARQERKKKVDNFLKMYQNDPDFTEIVFLVKLLVALDIIPV